MSKTDKELVTELTIAFVQSWNSKPSTSAINGNAVVDIFNEFKKLITNFDSTEE